MRDDILIITEHHQRAAQSILDLVVLEIRNKSAKFLITIAGESGAGKSEVAAALANMMDKSGLTTYIIQQDDYFEYPPRTNARMRESDIGRIGPGEVRLGLLNENIRAILDENYPLVKPLVIFSEDRITQEQIDLTGYQVVIIEGTYTSLLNPIDCKVFIDRDLEDTRDDRLKRNREKQDDYLERILEIEHRIISRHKEQADIIISDMFIARKNI